jgi:hypothetical protein
VCALALLTLAACGGGESPENDPREADPPKGDAPEAGIAAVHGDAPRVAYRGPRELSGPVTLRAAPAATTAGSGASRIVAVTFLLDGQPLGTDTTAPYELDVNAGFLAPGSHQVRVAAVDRLGRRSSTRSVSVQAGGSPGPVLSVSGQGGLEQALPALARGDVTVRLRPGRYRVSEARLGSGARLVGSGRDTVLEPPKGASYQALLVPDGRRIRVSNLALDGGGAGGGEGRAVEVQTGSADVRLNRLRIRRARQVGVYVRGVHSEVSVQDSTINGRGRADAGVFFIDPQDAGEYRDPSVIRTRIRGFRQYGILFAHREHHDPDAGLRALALDNRVSRIRNPARDDCVRNPSGARRCGTDEGGIWSGGVRARIIGNRVRRARWDGIQTVGSSDHVTIARNAVRKTRTGVYLEHSTNDSLVKANRIARVRTGINVEWTHDGAGSQRNTLARNRIVSASGAGVFVDVGDDGHRILGNLFVGGARPAIVLQGSSRNVVRGNRTCKRDGTVVHEQAGRWDDGSLAQSRANQITDNRHARSCRSP